MLNAVNSPKNLSKEIKKKFWIDAAGRITTDPFKADSILQLEEMNGKQYYRQIPLGEEIAQLKIFLKAFEKDF